jgi:DNA-binding response OmpR family regulator
MSTRPSPLTSSMADPAADARALSVLLAEHEPEVAEMSARYLRRDGYRVRLVTTPELALAELTAGPDAVAVLDLTMPGLDPRHIRRALRTPVIFLLAGPRPRGLAQGTPGSGPRRWLARPFGPRQLVTLVRDVLAQGAPWPAAGPGAAGADASGGYGPAERVAGGLRLDARTRTVRAGACTARLTGTEYAVLTALLDRPGRALSRARLLAAAGRGKASPRAADVYIAQLRGKLGPAVAIRTVRGLGYAIDL